jgi:signal transduction histidine kinase
MSVTALVALGGWPLALAGFAAALVLRSRLERVARAEHELRGPATVISMACERLRRQPAARRQIAALDTELARLRAGLDDLTAARCGRRRAERPVRLDVERMAGNALAAWRPALAAAGREARIDWRAGEAPVRADSGRVAQALGNLLANAAEHGRGPVELRSRRVADALRLEVLNGTGRGRGLAIVSDAAASAGGRLELVSGGEEVVAALELPLSEDPGPSAA